MSSVEQVKIRNVQTACSVQVFGVGAMVPGMGEFPGTAITLSPLQRAGLVVGIERRTGV